MLKISSRELEWNVVNLSDYIAVKGLLKFRSHFDLESFNKETIAIYVELDYLISICNFNYTQLKILELYQEGLSEFDIANIFDVSPENIFKRITNLSKKIADKCIENWKYNFLQWNLVRVDENWQQCSVCKDFLPSSKFGSDSRRRFGKKSICKKCDSYTKKG